MTFELLRMFVRGTSFGPLSQWRGNVTGVPTESARMMLETVTVRKTQTSSTTSPNMFWMAVATGLCTSRYLAFAPSNDFGVTAVFKINDSQTKHFLYDSLSLASRKTPWNRYYRPIYILFLSK